MRRWSVSVSSFVAVSAVLVLAGGSPARGAGGPDAVLVPDDVVAGDNAGVSVAIDGDVAVVGAPNEPQAAPDGPGAAYVFTRNGDAWTQTATLQQPGTPQVNAWFGDQVAVSGDTIAVGVAAKNLPGHPAAGAVDIFVNDGADWVFQAELTEPVVRDGAYFGWHLALDGDTLVVGDPGFGLRGTADPQASGTAYVFHRSGSTWTSAAQLVMSDREEYDNAGTSVSVDGDTIAVGAPYHGSGAVYLFTGSGSTWTQQAELQPTGAGANDTFGDAVTVRGDGVVIGAPYAAPRGAVYVSERSGQTWSAVEKLAPAVPEYWNRFGDAVAVDGPVALVGNLDADASVWVRFGGDWVERGLLVGTGIRSGDVFGRDVALSGATALIGAPGTAGGAGAAHVRDLSTYLVRTLVSGPPEGWSKVPVTVTLQPESAVGSIVSTEWKLVEDADWTEYAAPFVISAQGESWILDRATDSVGNSSSEESFSVRIDGRRPTTRALAKATCVKGARCRLRYRVDDALPGSRYADVTIRIVNKAGRVVRRLVVGELVSNKNRAFAFTCSLKTGTYTFTAAATDLAGNTQWTAQAATLTVTK